MVGHSSTHCHLHPQEGQHLTAKIPWAFLSILPSGAEAEGDENRDTIYLLAPLPPASSELVHCTYQKAIEEEHRRQKEHIPPKQLH